MENRGITSAGRKEQRETIIAELRKKGCRITKQRRVILDVILENECSCCKEIFFRASEIDSGIGTATVYRMVNTLEEIGIINRKNMYKVESEESVYASSPEENQACGIDYCEVLECIIDSLDRRNRHEADPRMWVSEMALQLGELMSRSCGKSVHKGKLDHFRNMPKINLSEELREKTSELDEYDWMQVNEYCILRHWQEIINTAERSLVISD